ncbi:hypothetical protein BASA60_011258 [Batrachochytrium salamandrivorans]|nr:hypothetical protein BASA60_011258 [Batrachochytrium salamandrivorans]
MEPSRVAQGLITSLDNVIYVSFVYIYLLDFKFFMLILRALALAFQTPFMQSKSAKLCIGYVFIVNGFFLLGHFSAPVGPSAIIDFFGPVSNTSCLFLIFNDILVTFLQLLRTIVLCSVKSSTQSSQQLFTISPKLRRTSSRSHRRHNTGGDSQDTDVIPSTAHLQSVSSSNSSSVALVSAASDLEDTHALVDPGPSTLQTAPQLLANPLQRRSQTDQRVSLPSTPHSSTHMSQTTPTSPSTPDELSTVFTMGFDIYGISRRVFYGSNRHLRRHAVGSNLPRPRSTAASTTAPRRSFSGVDFNGLRTVLNWRIMRLNSLLRAQRRGSQTSPEILDSPHSLTTFLEEGSSVGVSQPLVPRRSSMVSNSMETVPLEDSLAYSPTSNASDGDDYISDRFHRDVEAQRGNSSTQLGTLPLTRNSRNLPI